MPLHEYKQCPRCGQSFECRSGSVTLCQCQDAALTPEQREYIAARHDHCLCRACLAALRQECVDQAWGM